MIPKWVFDERLTLPKFYVFSTPYKKKDGRLIRLLLEAPSEFTMKNVLFGENGLVRM